jgi:NAD(P)-dependent dehydrogenase (short-subunit alcohol dehydrogenase family)
MLAIEGGSIISIASIIGLVGYYPGVPAVGANHAAAKSGVIGFIRQVAIEYARDKIRANAIAPGRRGTPEELEGLAIFLASDASRYITGQVFVQNGGWTAA